MRKLTKKLINYVAQAAQLAPPAVPKPEPPPLAPAARPPRQTTPSLEPPNPPLNTPPVPPATPVQIWPNPNVPIVDCENKPLPTSWPFPTPPIKGLTSDTDAEWQKKVCAGITKHYTEMRRRLDTCFGNCSSGGEEYNFEQCLRLFYDGLVSAAVMPYEYQNELTQFADPPERDLQLSPTQRRNCEKYKTRCHCSFERKRWEKKLEAAKLAEFYAAGCKPFVIRVPNSEAEQDRLEQERKKRFKEECDRVKKIFPFGSKCARDGEGKYVYADCKDACEKCGVQ